MRIILDASECANECEGAMDIIFLGNCGATVAFSSITVGARFAFHWNRLLMGQKRNSLSVGWSFSGGLLFHFQWKLKLCHYVSRPRWTVRGPVERRAVCGYQRLTVIDPSVSMSEREYGSNTRRERHLAAGHSNNCRTGRKIEHTTF